MLCEKGYCQQENLQGDQNFAVHMMITVRHYLAQPDCLAVDRQCCVLIKQSTKIYDRLGLQ
jgi:hypothetical protein